MSLFVGVCLLQALILVDPARGDDPPSESQPSAIPSDPSSPSVKKSSRRLGCFGLKSLLGLTAGVGAGLTFYFRTWEEKGIYLTGKQKLILNRKFTSYKDKEEFSDDLKALSPYVARALPMETFAWYGNNIHPHHEGYSGADELLGRIAAAEAWTPKMIPIVTKWRQQAPAFGVVLPTQEHLKKTATKYGLGSSTFFVGPLAARDSGAFAKSDKAGFEKFVAGYLADIIWDSPNLHWDDVGASLNISLRWPERDYPNTREIKTEQIHQWLK